MARIGKRSVALGTGIVLVAAAGLFVVREPAVQPADPGSLTGEADAAELTAERAATIVYDPVEGELRVLHGPVDLPSASSGEGGHTAHASDHAVFPTVTEVVVPIDGYVFAFYADLVDADGRVLPRGLLHHVNLVDPDRRELFAPIAQRIAAAGRETGVKSVPPRLFGLPVREGQRLVIHTMLHNPTPNDLESVVVRFHLRLSPGDREPLFSVYPFWVDVRLPAGDKTFDLPPGRSSAHYEARPAIAGRILALSGHVHTHATALRFEDVTTGETLWHAEPELYEDGTVAGVPIGRPFLHLGHPVTPEHTYRLTVEYDNPTGETLLDGGMGSIGGIFLPSRGGEWPEVDPSLELYQLDLKHYYRELLGKLEDLRAPSAGAVEHPGTGHEHVR